MTGLSFKRSRTSPHPDLMSLVEKGFAGDAWSRGAAKRCRASHFAQLFVWRRAMPHRSRNGALFVERGQPLVVCPTGHLEILFECTDWNVFNQCALPTAQRNLCQTTPAHTLAKDQRPYPSNRPVLHKITPLQENTREKNIE